MSDLTHLTDQELVGICKALRPLLSTAENELERREWSRLIASKQEQDTDWPDALEIKA